MARWIIFKREHTEHWYAHGRAEGGTAREAFDNAGKQNTTPGQYLIARTECLTRFVVRPSVIVEEEEF